MIPKEKGASSAWNTLPFPIRFIDKRLPGIKAMHFKILLFTIVVEALFLSIKKQPILSEQTLGDFIMLLFMMEIFMLLAFRIFVKGTNLGDSRKEITKRIAVRYLFFHLGCLLIALLATVLYIMVVCSIHRWNIAESIGNFFTYEFLMWLKTVNIGLMFGAFFFVIAIWQDALAQAQKLKEEKLIFQYETLKNQVNPHFLFNSLNTLSSLVGTSPELAERFIQKLSSIYRYVLEYREIETVDLSSEIAFVKDYFYLQQTRDEDKISLVIDIPEPSRYKILPMSLQLLVENALKHNSATREKPLKIYITQVGNSIEVRNNLQKKMTMEPSQGIGLKNLGERVKYIIKTELQVIETTDEFKVIVPIIPQ